VRRNVTTRPGEIPLNEKKYSVNPRIMQLGSNTSSTILDAFVESSSPG